MKKYIVAIAIILSVFTATLTSCGGTDASNNNGSDTGVSGTNSGVEGRSTTGGGMSDSSSGGTMSTGPDSGGIVENDVYSNDGFADDSMGGATGTAGDVMNGTDMSYDAGGSANNTTLNY